MIDRLEMFLALARHGHFGRAAEAAGVSQPTLSAAVRALEDQLGVRLVERGSRFQGLTPEGARVLEWARRITSDARTMREEMRAARTGLVGHLRLAAIPTALAVTPQLTTPFRASHPAVTLSIVSRTSLQIIAALENLEIEAGLTYLEEEPLGRVTTVPLYAERYRLVTSAGAPLADRASVTWAEAGALPLCLLTPDMQNRRLIDRHLRAAGVQVRPALESNSMIVLFAHVHTGRWASIMPAGLLRLFGLAEPLRAIPITEPEAAHRIGLVVAHREPHTPAVSALLHEARLLAARLEAEEREFR